MKSLRFLSLILDCSNWRVTRDSTYNPKFDEEDQKLLDEPLYFHSNPPFPFLKRSELKKTLINCAVDEELARSIWKTINRNKTGRQLERLKLWPRGGGEYGITARLPHDLLAIRQNLARSWIVERVPRDDDEEFLTVRELGQHRRMAPGLDYAYHVDKYLDLGIWELLLCGLSKDLSSHTTDARERVTISSSESHRCSALAYKDSLEERSPASGPFSPPGEIPVACKKIQFIICIENELLSYKQRPLNFKRISHT
ncbi:hypothetical protein CJF30_00001612 [Rutstroemia sp. NJR-2017a BBW]|nr:hypothetical protein CJF30_00001612 [Rutstroemia sp. NJR-2017a BBW]